MEKVALGHVFSEYFGFPCKFSFHRLLHAHRLSSEAGTIGQLVTDVPSGLIRTPPQETKKENNANHSALNFGRHTHFSHIKICFWNCTFLKYIIVLRLHNRDINVTNYTCNLCSKHRKSYGYEDRKVDALCLTLYYMTPDFF
jgi:hypothetical protein